MDDTLCFECLAPLEYHEIRHGRCAECYRRHKAAMKKLKKKNQKRKNKE